MKDKRNIIAEQVIMYARKYKKNLEHKNILIVSENKKTREIDFIETYFTSRHFKHLTGLGYNTNDQYNNNLRRAVFFYKQAVSGKILPENLIIKNETVIRLKLDALNQLCELPSSARMIGNYCGITKNKLYTEKVSGTIHYSLGFVKEQDTKYYVPNTALSENIKDIVDTAQPIIAILSKNDKEKKYSKITYLSKDMKIMKLLRNIDLANLLDIENMYATKAKDQPKMQEFNEQVRTILSKQKVQHSISENRDFDSKNIIEK